MSEKLEIKQKAIAFKQRAKELGYEIKLTHCQEILARINGHSTRHSLLKEQNNDSNTKHSDKIIQDMANGFIKKSSQFSEKDLQIMQSIDFQKKIETIFLSNVIKELDSHISDSYHKLESSNNFIWSCDNLIGNVKKIIKERTHEVYSLEDYLTDLNTGKFKDRFFMGLYKFRGEIKTEMVNPLVHPHNLFIGFTGTGKTESNKFSILTWLLANGEKTKVYINSYGGKINYKEFLHCKQVSFCDTQKEFTSLINNLSEEAELRISEFTKVGAKNIIEYEKITNKTLPRVIMVLDDMICLNSSSAYGLDDNDYWMSKITKLIRIGGSLGIWFNRISQTIDVDDSAVRTQISLFSNKNVFKTRVLDCFIGVDTKKASMIDSSEVGRFIRNDIEYQFPYLNEESKKMLLNTYLKPFKCKFLFKNLK